MSNKIGELTARIEVLEKQVNRLESKIGLCFRQLGLHDSLPSQEEDLGYENISEIKEWKSVNDSYNVGECPACMASGKFSKSLDRYGLILRCETCREVWVESLQSNEDPVDVYNRNGA